MQNKDLLPKISVGLNAPLSAAIACIDASGGEIALVIDADGRLAGTITDGDIRRGILRGLNLETPASAVMNVHPRSAPHTASAADVMSKMHAEQVLQMPVVDAVGVVVGIQFAKAYARNDINRHKVVIMAGGLGTRLRPFTETVPKPMIEVGGRPILETIIERLRAQGFNQVVLSLNHLAEIIIDHFGDGSRFGVEITYVQETQRLGTAGALSLLPPQDLPLVVMNGDILTSVNFGQLLSFHYEHGAQATMGLNRYQYQLAYGVVEVKDWHITSFAEKPVYDFFINAGIYVVSPEALAKVPVGQYFDMPSLFALLAPERRVAFPIHEYWLDIGRHEDLAKASNQFKDGV